MVERGENRVGVYQIDTPQRKTINGRRVLELSSSLGQHKVLWHPQRLHLRGSRHTQKEAK